MSRTYRRNETHLIARMCGRVEDIDSWDRRRFPASTDEKCLRKKKARFTADRPSGRYSAPYWWRLLHYNKPSRRRARRELHRCIRNDNWDDHLTIEIRGARSWYWWVIQ